MFFARMNDDARHLIIAFILLFVLVFVIFALLGKLVYKVMKWEGKKADDMVHDVLVSGVITKESKLFFFGLRKNRRLLIKQSYIPFIILLVGSLTLLIYCLVYQRWGFNPFGSDQYGFGTLFYHFDWAGATEPFFGIPLIARWPEVTQAPYFSVDAWGSYVFVPCLIVGGVWFALMCQAYMARTIRLFFITKSAFRKNLSDYNPNNTPVGDINPEFPNDNK